MKVTEKLFKDVKQYSDEGKTCREIAKIVGVSYHTIAYIIRSDSLEHYHFKIVEKNDLKKRRSDMLMGAGTHVDENTYNQVKQAISNKATVKSISDVFNISGSTVYRIKTSDCFDSYKNKWKQSEDTEDDINAYKTVEKIAETINELLEETKAQTKLLNILVSKWD